MDRRKSRSPERPGRSRVGGGRVSDVLLAGGKISEEQLGQAQEACGGHPAKVGRALVSLGFVSEADLARAEAERLNLSYSELDESDVDPRAVSLVPERVLRRHMALPLRVEKGRLLVATSDPTDLHAVEDLRITSGLQITRVVVTQSGLRETRARVFARGERVAGILEAEPEEEESEGEVQLEAAVEPDAPPVLRLVDTILQRAVVEGASDIHLEPHPGRLIVRYRVDGVLRRVMSVPNRFRGSVVARLKVLGGLDIAERRMPQDGRFSIRANGRKVDVRVASLPTVLEEGIVLRLLDTGGLNRDLASLGLSGRDLERYRRLCRRPYGTVLVTGPTGSGKSTTLYATLSELNSPERKIITIEDPVEYSIAGLSQLQVNPRAGLTFASGLRNILRADPDIVMVGEIRDLETARTAVEASLTGHLVFATLHTGDAPSALARLTNMGVEPFLTASAVSCVVAQRLARRLCESCKRPSAPGRTALEEARFPFDVLPESSLNFHEAPGCNACGGTGHRGRVGVYELMEVTEETAELIVKRAPATELRRAAERTGMLGLRENGLVKAGQGTTSMQEILRTVV